MGFLETLFSYIDSFKFKISILHQGANTVSTHFGRILSVIFITILFAYLITQIIVLYNPSNPEIINSLEYYEGGYPIEISNDNFKISMQFESNYVPLSFNNSFFGIQIYTNDGNGKVFNYDLEPCEINYAGSILQNACITNLNSTIIGGPNFFSNTYYQNLIIQAIICQNGTFIICNPNMNDIYNFIQHNQVTFNLYFTLKNFNLSNIQQPTNNYLSFSSYPIEGMYPGFSTGQFIPYKIITTYGWLFQDVYIQTGLEKINGKFMQNVSDLYPDDSFIRLIIATSPYLKVFSRYVPGFEYFLTNFGGFMQTVESVLIFFFSIFSGKKIVDMLIGKYLNLSNFKKRASSKPKEIELGTLNDNSGLNENPILDKSVHVKGYLEVELLSQKDFNKIQCEIKEEFMVKVLDIENIIRIQIQCRKLLSIFFDEHQRNLVDFIARKNEDKIFLTSNSDDNFEKKAEIALRKKYSKFESQKFFEFLSLCASYNYVKSNESILTGQNKFPRCLEEATIKILDNIYMLTNGTTSKEKIGIEVLGQLGVSI